MNTSWKGAQAKAGAVSLYFETHGSGEPLICLHNFSSNSRTLFNPLLPELTKHYTCYLVDLRGHGRSDNPVGTWSHEDSAWDIIRFCETIGITRARFLAASSGGMTMLRVARYKPELVEAMVLDSATYRVPIEARKFYKPYSALSPKLVKYYAAANEIYGSEYGPVLAKTFYDFRLPECDINVPLELLSTIRSPTLVLSGDRDSFFTVDIAIDMRLTIPGSELFVFPNTQHIVMAFHPEMVARHAIEFFARHTSPKA